MTKQEENQIRVKAFRSAVEHIASHLYKQVGFSETNLETQKANGYEDDEMLAVINKRIQSSVEAAGALNSTFEESFLELCELKKSEEDAR